MVLIVPSIIAVLYLSNLIATESLEITALLRLLFYRVTATQFILYMVPFTDVPIVISPSVVKDPNMQYGSIGMLPTCSMI